MDRRELFGARATVALVGAVAALSVATGVANIGTGIDGPLAAVVPRSVQRTAGFTGALTGFLMLVSAYGLRRRVRAAWYSTVVLLPLTAIQGLAQSSVVSYPLVALSVAALPAVLVHRRAFDRALDLTSSQLAAIAAIVGAQAYGTAGTYYLREQFSNVRTLTDAFYYTLVTASTVGYGDAAPETQAARLFTMSVIVIGTASFAAALGTLVGPAIESRLSQALGTMTDAQLDLLDDHVIVVGVSDLTEPILEELDEGDVPVLVITRDSDRASRLRDREWEVLVADPSDEEPLRKAGIERARALVAATDDDAQDALAILTARELNRDLRIVAAATERENVKKLQRAGADEVVSPATIGGHLLVQSALGTADAAGVAERIMSDDGQ